MVEHVPCLAWSRHAAELAEPRTEWILRWPDSPATDGMVRDGLLHRLMAGCYAPPDLLADPVSRILMLGCALGSALRPDHVVAGASAAWVMVGGTPPRIPVLLSSAHRTVISAIRVRTTMPEPSQIELRAGAPLTVPVRTAIDLLRDDDPTAAYTWLPPLLHSGHLDADELTMQLEASRGKPGMRLARERQRALAARQACAEASSLRGIGARESTGRPSAVTR